MEQESQPPSSIFNTKTPEMIPASSEALALLLPLVAPAIAYAVRIAARLLKTRQKAKTEEKIDNREYLQQQNDLLLRELLDRTQDPKA